MKQRDFSALGVRPTTYNNWERGVSLPGARTLMRLGEFFQISVDDLLRRDIGLQGGGGGNFPGQTKALEQLKTENRYLHEKITWLEQKGRLLEELVQALRAGGGKGGGEAECLTDVEHPGAPDSGSH